LAASRMVNPMGKIQVKVGGGGITPENSPQGITPS